MKTIEQLIEGHPLMNAENTRHGGAKAASERATSEPAGPAKVVAAVATGSGSVPKRRWREYPAEQFSEADLPVWGYYPDRTHSVRLIDFMGNEMTHWMPARDDIPEAPSGRQPTPKASSEPCPPPANQTPKYYE